MAAAYRYNLELFDGAGDSLGNAPLRADWEPAGEWARLQAIRSGALPPSGSRARYSVLPRWHEKLGRPYLSGFRVELESGELGSNFDSTYFVDQARVASAKFIADGKLQQGEEFKYAVTAYPIENPSEDPGAPFRVEDASSDFPLRREAIQPYLERSELRGSSTAGDLPLFVPQRVLDEATRLARDAGDREAGGVLIGHLCRDPDGGELFAVVKAQVAATKARGDISRLTFTPETWTEVKAMVDLRRRNEIFLGWIHSHPVDRWECRNCPLERRRVCPLASDFFSAQDKALHRTVFPRAYSLAIVINRIAEDEQTYSCFGWRQGIIQTRAFHLLNDDEPGPRAA